MWFSLVYYPSWYFSLRTEVVCVCVCVGGGEGGGEEGGAVAYPKGQNPLSVTRVICGESIIQSS